ncbi:MAG: transposase [Tolypothrix carrinoi HA7290-LM1]|jgi:transposase|nr:transposase [Tolypothrix carrinoi HA7290-LM1]
MVLPKPNKDHRAVINGILWILRTGASWRDLPEHYGSWESIATRFYRWQKAGVWNQILEHLQAIPSVSFANADEQGKLVVTVPER